MESWFCSPLLSISRKKTQTVVLSRRWAHYAFFPFAKAQSYLPPALPQSGNSARTGISCSIAGATARREPHRHHGERQAGACRARNRVRRQLREIYRLHEQELARPRYPCRGGAFARDRRAVLGSWRRHIALGGRAARAAAGGCMKRQCSGLIRFYQRHISPWFPRRCRFFSDLLAVRLEAIHAMARCGADGWRSNG